MARTRPIFVKLNITQSDIYLGNPATSSSCPVALALKREFPNYFKVYVTNNYAQVTTKPKSRFFGLLKGKSKYITIPLPKSVSKFITNFDNYNDDATKPFSIVVKGFEVEY